MKNAIFSLGFSYLHTFRCPEKFTQQCITILYIFTVSNEAQNGSNIHFFSSFNKTSHNSHKTSKRGRVNGNNLFFIFMIFPSPFLCSFFKYVPVPVILPKYSTHVLQFSGFYFCDKKCPLPFFPLSLLSKEKYNST